MSPISTEEFEKAIKAAGYYVSWCRTGSPNWFRGFILKMGEGDIPTQYARASFECGELYNVKFYWRQYTNSDLNESDYLIYFWRAYKVTKQYLTIDEYNEIVKQAEKMREAEYQERLDKRAETNRLNPKKRRSIKGRCVRRFIEKIIDNLAKSKENKDGV